ncbi:MAG: hypothetical protein WCF54_18780 [Terracidiphilus sp.]
MKAAAEVIEAAAAPWPTAAVLRAVAEQSGRMLAAVAVVCRTAAQQSLTREPLVPTRRSTHRPHALVHLLQRQQDVPALHVHPLRTAAAEVMLAAADTGNRSLLN